MLAEVMVALQSFPLGGGESGGMLAQEIWVNLCVLRSILVHSEAYRGAYRASREAANRHNHHHLLSYWNWLIPRLSMPKYRAHVRIANWSCDGMHY